MGNQYCQIKAVGFMRTLIKIVNTDKHVQVKSE